jgi:hypothetical protein
MIKKTKYNNIIQQEKLAVLFIKYFNVLRTEYLLCKKIFIVFQILSFYFSSQYINVLKHPIY